MCCHASSARRFVLRNEQVPRWGEIIAFSMTQWVLLVLSCINGVAISYAGVNVQKYVTASTFIVLTNTNKFAVVAFGIFVLGEARAWQAVVGCVLALSGGFWYGKARADLDEGKTASTGVPRSRYWQAAAVLGVLLFACSSLAASTPTSKRPQSRPLHESLVPQSHKAREHTHKGTEPNAQGEHAKETASSKSKSKATQTLVVMFGNIRGGEATWTSFYRNVLNPDINSDIDLALSIGSLEPNDPVRNSSLLRRARYIWFTKEVADWGVHIDALARLTIQRRRDAGKETPTSVPDWRTRLRTASDSEELRQWYLWQGATTPTWGGVRKGEILKNVQHF